MYLRKNMLDYKESILKYNILYNTLFSHSKMYFYETQFYILIFRKVLFEI